MSIVRRYWCFAFAIIMLLNILTGCSVNSGKTYPSDILESPESTENVVIVNTPERTAESETTPPVEQGTDPIPTDELPTESYSTDASETHVEGTPTAAPTQKSTAAPTQKSTATPTQKSTATPTQRPTATPTVRPTSTPTNRPTLPPTFDNVTSWYHGTDSLICEGVYIVGQSIKSGKCTLSYYKSSTNVIVFSTIDDYYLYFKSDRFTNGDEWDAIDQYSSFEKLIYERTIVDLDLADGNVLIIRNGIARVSFDNDSQQSLSNQLGEARWITKGCYTAGKDIKSGAYILSCFDDKYPEIAVFVSESEFKAFEKAPQITNGEYWSAIEANAFISILISKEEQCYVDLKEGMIIMISSGCAIQPVKMNWSI